MAKLGIFASIAAILSALTFATVSSATAAGAAACVHKDLKTVIAKEACDKGGQPAAKDAMKKFMKDAKIKSCNQCHTKLAPSYELKKDALDQFKKAGGKLL
jgi:Na+-translocating ferredoxin:NAD+ oxidoreductase RnfG subunit